MKQRIADLCDRFEKDVIAIRRALHRVPEASFAEKKTQALVASYLKRACIDFKPAAKTGLSGLITPSRGGAARKGLRTVGIRADMDALNLTERTGLPFASRNRGYMHACGHDAHMAILLGAGMVLKSLGKDLPGNVRLIFQPAEETPPGGALGMIKAGVLDRPKVGAVLGFHVEPAIAAGKVGFLPGPISAAADDFNVKIVGRAGHGSTPHRGLDAILVAAHFVTAVQAVVSRRVSALDDVVVSVGTIHGGARHNIIAESVEMEGTIRTRSARLRREVPAMVKQVLDGTCAAFGAKGEFEFVKGYPAVICDEGLTESARGWCKEVLGKARVVTGPGFEMGGEDFAYYAEKVPGTEIFIGVSNPRKGKSSQLHKPEFDIDEDALKVGLMAVAYSAYCYLERGIERGIKSPAGTCR